MDKQQLIENAQECMRAQDVYDIILFQDMINEIDINHKFCKIEYNNDCLKSSHRNDKDSIIANTLIRNSIINNVIDKNNYEAKCNIILAGLYDYINELIQYKEMQYLLSLLSILECNRYYAMGITLWSRRQSIEADKGTIIATILQILNSKKIEENKETYVFFDNYLATDKNAIENIFPYIYKKIVFHKNSEKRVDISEMKIGEVLECIRGILLIHSIKDEFKNGNYHNRRIKIDSKGYMIFASERCDNDEGYYKFIMTENDNHIDEIMKDQIDKVIEPIIGLSKKNNLLLREALTNFEGLLNNEFLIMNKEIFIKKLKEKCGLSSETVKKFCDYITYRLPKDMFDGKTHFSQKITRRSLLCFQDIVITPISLIKASITNNYTDILYNQTDDEYIRGCLTRVYTDINREFEKSVFILCKEKLHPDYIEMNVQQKQIKNNEEILILPGEIDVLVLYNEILFVIECKNIETKSTYDMINKAKGDFEGTYKRNSYQNKLTKKIEALDNGKRILFNYIGKKKIKKIVGCIVTNGYFMQSSELKKHEIVSKRELVNWIQNYI